MHTLRTPLLLLVPLLTLAACEDQGLERLPPAPITTVDADEGWEVVDSEEPADSPPEECAPPQAVPTCNFYLLRPEEGRIAFYVDVEGVAWEAVAVTVEDSELHWGLMQTGPEGTLSVPLDLDSRWSVEATVLTPEGEMLPCGSLTAPLAP